MEQYPRKNASAPFLVLGGFADFILPSSYSNAHGAISGLGNVAPVSSHPRLLPVPYLMFGRSTRSLSSGSSP